ncbi:MAG: ABC transporter ATP-binding protein [Deltaproteobacteria bacterium]|nr:MAG: ABC transporter ATP-binding protein [Deltaproteobacteria bacterium]
MIQVDGVTKTFRSGRGTVRALRDATFSVDAVQFAAVIGKSGSGKSTLLNCLGGLEPPDSGTVRCFGTSLYSLNHHERSRFQRRHIGFIFQRGNLLSYLTVAENIGFPLSLNNITGNDHTRRIDELLDRTGLLAAARALPHELSGGETQRVAVARAIAHHPKILLADEPTANLDTATGRQVVRLMQDMGQTDQCTIIMVTHDLEVVEAAAPIIYLRDGRIHDYNNGGARV